MLHVADHPHHLDRLLVEGDDQALAERAALGKGHLRQRLVDEHYPCGGVRLGLREDAAGPQRDAQGSEVARRGDAIVGVEVRVGIRLDHEIARAVPTRERKAGHRPHRFDAGPGREAPHHLAEERALRLLVRIPRRRERHVGGRRARRIEPRVDALQAHEAQHQETGADEQHQGQRHLGDDQRRAKPRRAGPTGTGSAGLLQRLGRHPDVQRGHQPEDEGRGEREPCGERENGSDLQRFHAEKSTSRRDLSAACKRMHRMEEIRR